jgi:hypothetical protein
VAASISNESLGSLHLVSCKRALESSFKRQKYANGCYRASRSPQDLPFGHQQWRAPVHRQDRDHRGASANVTGTTSYINGGIVSPIS